MELRRAGSKMNEDRGEPAAKRQRTVNDAADLQCAVINQNIAILEMLKDNEVYLTIDLTCTDEDGNTALHLIFHQLEESHVVQILQIFFDHRVDLNIGNKKMETPLHLAVAKRMRNAVELLIRHGADVNKCDDGGNSISHYFVEDEYKKFLAMSRLEEDFSLGLKRRAATEAEGASFVDWLISRGFDFGAPNLYGWTALHMAIERNLQHILPTIARRTEAIDCVDEQGRNLLHLFLQMNHKYRKRGVFGAPAVGVWSTGFSRGYAVEIVGILLDGGVSADAVDSAGDTPLHLAVRNMEDMEAVERLLGRFSAVHRRNGFGDTVFHEAIRHASSKFSSKVNYYLEIARALLAKGADANSRDRFGVAPIYYTVLEKRLPAIQLMKEFRADFGYVTKSDQNLLHLLAFKHDNDKRSDRSWESMCELLFSEGCLELDRPDRSGQSPLHLAIRHGNLIVARRLIEGGADVNARDAEGARPLDRVGAASRPGDGHAVLRMLLGHGAHANARDNHGGTALSHALAIGSADNVAELLRHGADVNEPFFLDLVALQPGPPHDDRALDLVLRHCLKLKAAGLPCSREYDGLARPDEHRRAHQDCLREVEALRRTPVAPGTSLLRWLRMGPADRCAHAGALAGLVRCRRLRRRFPNYCALVLAGYREAVARAPIAAAARRAWRALVGPALPDGLVERVLAHLHNADLLSLVDRASDAGALARDNHLSCARRDRRFADR
ncbi:serine/threonine-protein phosphatase 6 regulatory ankyrin repeat subunit A-like [Phymastichus coffea]|uniref:serine/threonine-protein phosphatase 6 regulatory ankyrin repeat subunit A-like n=1 Tax=Phymastichus coffea TaxID=108790 RepID=UPI00273AE163|nr:serine/threonine-protein phosphatase 6 regulatory ankyrin repeat subunit A-like [Phymastichus coffea]